MRRFLACAMLLFAALLAGCGSQSSSGTRSTATPSSTTQPTALPNATLVVTGGSTAAIVNGQKIPMSTFRIVLGLAQRSSARQPGITPKLLANESMNAVIADELVRQYAVAHGLAVTAGEVSARIKQDETRNGGERKLKQALAQYGLSFADYKLLTRAGVQRHKVASVVSPLQTAHVRHILIMTSQHKPPRSVTAARSLATQLLGRLRHGASFSTLAHRYSDDTQSAKQGGLLPSFCPGLGLMVPQFDRASATLPLHRPTMVQSRFGFHIVEVLSRGPAKPGACREPGMQVDPQPEQTTAFQRWIALQKRHAKIQEIARVP